MLYESKSKINVQLAVHTRSSRACIPVIEI